MDNNTLQTTSNLIIIGILNEDDTITTAVQYLPYRETDNDTDAENRKCTAYGTRNKYEKALKKRFNTEDKVRNLISYGGWVNFLSLTEKLILQLEILKEIKRARNEYKEFSSEYRKTMPLKKYPPYKTAKEYFKAFTKVERLYLFGKPTPYDRFTTVYADKESIVKHNQNNYIYLFNPFSKRNKWCYISPVDYDVWREKMVS